MSAAHRHPLTVELAIRDGKITRRYQTRETAWDGPSEPLKQITTKGPGGKSVPLKTLTEWLASLSERPEETDQLEP